MERGVLPVNKNVEESPVFDAMMKNLMSCISNTGISKEKEEAIIQQMKILKRHQQTFLRNKFLYDTLKMYCADDNSGNPLLHKVAEVIATEELPIDVTIQRLPPITPEEVQELRYLAEERIIVKNAQMRNLMYESGTRDAEWLPLSEGENLIVKSNEILSETVKTYNTAAHTYLDKTLLLWDICDKSCKASLSNLDWLKKKSSLLNLKLRTLECRVLLAFYTEEPQQIEALELIEVVLKEKVSELKKEIQTLQSAITQYNKLKGTEYDTILHQYSDVKRKLKEQEWTLNHVSNC